MLMWPTNTTTVEAFEFRSEEHVSLGTDTDTDHSTGRGGAQVKIQGLHVNAAANAIKIMLCLAMMVGIVFKSWVIVLSILKSNRIKLYCHKAVHKTLLQTK